MEGIVRKFGEVKRLVGRDGEIGRGGGRDVRGRKGRVSGRGNGLEGMVIEGEREMK